MRTTTARRARLLGAIASVLLLPLLAHAQSAVLQRGYDAGVTGADLSETVLKTANVTPSTFGLVFALPVDDAVFAQPLYVPNVTINQIVHNVVYVATMSDTVYAFDADTAGAPLWSLSLATLVGAAPVPVADFAFSGDRGLVGNLGILSTPVIDLSTDTMYVVACTQEGVSQSNPNGNMVYRLHAIDIRTGTPRQGSGVEIIGTYDGITSNARYLLQRMSLVLSGNNIVIAFGAMQLESADTYSGWVMEYDKSSLAQTGVFATIPKANLGGGVWQSGRPPVVDSAGDVYLFVGNGFGTGYDGVNDFAESVLKLDPANGLKLLDWFTPSDWAALDSGDLDIASSGPMLIPGTNLIAGGGKAGVLYVLNTANLGKYNSSDSQIVQKAQISTSEIRGGPVYWQRAAANGGPLMYDWGLGDQLKAFAFNGSTFNTTPVAKGSETSQIYPGGILTLSANGDAAGTGVLWATTAASGDAENNPPVPGVLHAYNAANVSQELWNSTMVASRDNFGNLGKFVPPLVANGKVYVATASNQVAVYGLLQSGGGSPDFRISAGPTTQSVAPGGSTAYGVDIGALNGFSSSVALSVSGLPGGVTGSFSPANVSGAGSSTLQITVSSGASLGTYPLTITGTSGSSSHSSVVSLVITVSPAPSIDGQAYGDSSTASTTIAAQGLTTYAGNELLLAFVATDYLFGSNTTVTGVAGGGITWSLVRRTNTQRGSSEIWSAFAPSTLANVTVTATLSNSVAASIYVASFNGVDPAQPIGATGTANSTSGAPTGSLVTTRNNSIVLGVGNDYDNAIDRTLGPGQSILHEYLTSTGDTYWVQRLDAPVATAGATAVINDTAPTTDRYNLSLVEVRPPSTVTATYSISGTLTPAILTAGSAVTLSGAANASATADASGSFSFNNLPNGSYVVTPSQAGVVFTPASQPVTVSGGNVTGISFTAASNGTTQVAVDAVKFKDAASASNTISSPALSTTAGNELLLAFVSTDYLGGANTAVTAVSGAGLTWTLVARANAQSGTSEIWRAFALSALASQTVTATLSQSVVASITVISFTGIDSSGTNGSNAIGATASASSGSGAPTASLVTTRAGSLVVGVGNDFDNAISRTPGTGQTLVHQDLAPTGDTYWVQQTSALTGAAGSTVRIYDTAPTGDRYNLAIAEVRGP